MCQDCVDKGALSQGTFDAIEAFVELWPGSEFGPAHIVLADDNVGNGNIEFCLRQIARYHPNDYGTDHSPEELAATEKFLRELLAIPEGVR